MNEENKYWGKYRGTVVNNVDPEQRGRIQALVPDVNSLIPITFAEPCVPLAGPTGPPMGVYMVPPIGAGVWIEFEHGDLDKPIWVGCRWGLQSDIPLAALAGNPADPNIVIQSLLQQGIIVSDLPPAPPPPVMPPIPTTGGVILRSTTGAYIVVNDAGIFISNGKGASLEMLGPAVMINKLALVVT
ncbi:baseplate assembly protein [Methylomonas sp. LWB]|uniref:phage baseplate assembly protein V n=1 Tax=Methylomonas sp. LWB TaxID=1905845 RepID=UPI0008D96B79|nr:phage baseplate assembly protein V [Methylomonas sp. LWB]OHX36208.1 baseplate assembly protein [Methylomonas sp. LWB]